MTYRFSRPNNYKLLNTICKDWKKVKAFVRYFYRAHKIKLHVSITEDDEFNTTTSNVLNKLKEIIK